MAQAVNDDELVACMATGDQSAFAQLVQRHLNDLLAFTERMTGNRADAEDIAQETFSKAWQHARKWTPGKAQYRTWLFQVAMNQARDRWRRQRPTETLDPALECTQRTPDDAADATEQSQRVQAALRNLPERQRGAVILSHYHGMTNIEAAHTLNISVEAVESLLGRARRTLRQTLANERG